MTRALAASESWQVVSDELVVRGPVLDCADRRVTRQRAVTIASLVSCRALLTAVVVAAVGAACTSSSSTTATGPTPAKCQVTLSAPPAIAAGGGTASVTVTTQPECAWTASTQASWITELLPASGQGSGQVTLRAAPNAQVSPREGEALVNDARVRFTQEGAPCRFELMPAGRDVPATEESGSFDVVGQPGCAWTATSNAIWVSVTGTATGSGNGSVSYAVQANTGGPRSGGITAGGQTFVINQASGVSSCTYALGATSASMPAAGGTGSVDVMAGGGCAWTATSNAPWITVTGGASGTGDGTVSFAVDANAGAVRSGTISVAGSMLTVNQAAAAPTCTYMLSAASFAAAAGGEAGTVDLTTDPACAWTAVSNDAFLTVTSAASGTGSTTVAFTVDANAGGARAGTLTIGGETFTVNQDAAAPTCTFTLMPEDTTIVGGGTRSFDVVTESSCGWTAVSDDPWIHVTSGDSGTGDGTVELTIDGGGIIRSGTVTVGDGTTTATFTVDQLL